MTALPLKPAGMGLWTLDSRLGETGAGATLPALLDTGAAFTTVNAAAAADAGLQPDATAEPMYVSGADGNPMALRVAGADVTVDLGAGVRLQGTRPLLGDLPAFAALAMAVPGQGAIILGLDAMLSKPRAVFSATRRTFAI